MSDGFWRGLFVVAAVFNVAAGLPPLVAPEQTLETFGMAPMPDHLFMRDTGLLVLTFGVGYWFVSRNLNLREIVWLGVIGKSSVVVLFAWSWMRGLVSSTAAAVGMGDLLFVIGFLSFLATHRPSAKPA